MSTQQIPYFLNIDNFQYENMHRGRIIAGLLKFRQHNDMYTAHFESNNYQNSLSKDNYALTKSRIPFQFLIPVQIILLLI